MLMFLIVAAHLFSNIYFSQQYVKERDKMMEAYFICSLFILITILTVQYTVIPRYKSHF